MKEYNFPIFDDTIKTLQQPTENVLDFAKKVKEADGIIIVTPEYNGGLSANLKNAIDNLCYEWQGKPFSISTLSDGIFGGSQALASLQFILWKIGALIVTNMYPAPTVSNTFDENGIATDKTCTERLTKVFIDELLESIEDSK